MLQHRAAIVTRHVTSHAGFRGVCALCVTGYPKHALAIFLLLTSSSAFVLVKSARRESQHVQMRGIWTVTQPEESLHVFLRQGKEEDKKTTARPGPTASPLRLLKDNSDRLRAGAAPQRPRSDASCRLYAIEYCRGTSESALDFIFCFGKNMQQPN